jgi:hypothetical protein
MGVTSVPNEAQWYHAALAVSDGIERSCWVSFREDGITVPDGLKVVVARAIAAMLGQLKPSVTPGLQSETFSSYSYTLADTAAASDSLAAFSGDIKRYRRPFLGA